ncbi:MAG: hypothetical protein QF745_02380, partial [Planctomycetota bacterium]|nr:hypothetical protein [Planctomycetota bacterium]
METNVVSPILGREAARNRRAEAKAEKAAEVGAVRAHEAHDLALSPAPDGRAVEAGAVPAALRAAEGQAPSHPEVLVLLRVLREEPRDSAETQRQRPYAVHISRTNASPRSVLTSTMDRAGSLRKGIARKAKTASFNTLMNPALPHGALQTGSRPTRKGRRARRTAKQEIDRTRPLPEEGAQARRIKRIRRQIIRNPLQAHHGAAEART